MSSTLAMLRRATQQRTTNNENQPSSPSPFTPNASNGFSSPFSYEREWLGRDNNDGSMPQQPLAPLVVPHLHPVASAGPMTVAERVAYGERLQKKMKIDEGKMPLVREFWETTNPEEREIFMLMMSVSNHNEATNLAINAAKTWKPTSAQQATIRTYTKLILLLPDLRYFMGGIEQAIVKTLTSQPAHGFPQETNEMAYETLLGVVARQVSLSLSQLKKMIVDSLPDPKHPGRRAVHIHELAEDILKNFPSKLKFSLTHSLAFYHHVAFIRAHVQKMHLPRQHWEKVDDDKEDMLNNGTPEEQVEALQMMYLLDIQKFPAAENAPTYALSSDIFGGKPKPWHQTLIKHAKAVSRVSGSAARKRKLAEVQEDIDDGLDEEQQEQVQQDPEDDDDLNGNLSEQGASSNLSV